MCVLCEFSKLLLFSLSLSFSFYHNIVFVTVLFTSFAGWFFAGQTQHASNCDKGTIVLFLFFVLYSPLRWTRQSECAGKRDVAAAALGKCTCRNGITE